VSARRSLLTGGLLVVADAWLLPLQATQAAQPATTAGTPPRALTGRPANAVPALAMDIRLDPSTRLLQGEGTWTLPPGVALALELDRRFKLESITADGRAQALPPDGTGRQRVSIAATPSRSQSWQFRWRGELAALDGSIDHRGVIGALPPMASVRGSYLPAGSAWYPEADMPAHFRVQVTLPAGQQAVVPGRLLSESTQGNESRASFETPLPTEGLTLMAGPYRIEERMLPLPGARKVRLRTYFTEALQPLAQDYLAAAAGYIERYDREIGNYAFDGFSIVSSPLPTGFGLPGATYIGESVLRLPFMRGQSLAHEVLHNWWGNGVRVDWRRGNWSEGLTTLMADHALRMAQSADAGRQMRWGWLRDFGAVPAGTDTPLDRFTSRTHGAASAVGYGKSAMLFHMVRAEIGEAMFGLALRDLWRSHAGTAAGWRDLQAAFERRAGRSLASLFAPMLSGTGAPVLVPQSIRHDAARSGLVVTFAEPIPYAFALPVAAWHGDRAQHAVLPLRSGERSALLPLQDARVPDALQVDPDFAAWRRLGPGESPPLLRDAMLAPDVRVLAVSDGDDNWRQAAGELAMRMLEAQRAPAARVADLDTAVPLLLIGRHEDIERLVRRDARLARPAALARMPDAALWAARSANGAPRVFVSVEDTAALIDLHRRAPHYGAQGHVGFRNGRAIASGVGPIETPKVPVSP
jgi:aminopeptidase N